MLAGHLLSMDTCMQCCVFLQTQCSSSSSSSSSSSLSDSTACGQGGNRNHTSHHCTSGQLVTNCCALVLCIWENASLAIPESVGYVATVNCQAHGFTQA
jgi:hypothetical protein